ncbi:MULTISPECIES: hypothetical protein [Enterobacteriaceae]|uniref:hypothetical protein n=1 Tax=Enterobacteriaceae TaxID=543 RepID=UPI0006681904|nr:MULTISPECIES: hypothetical protein [Enterobacteriaceae]
MATPYNIILRKILEQTFSAWQLPAIIMIIFSVMNFAVFLPDITVIFYAVYIPANATGMTGLPDNRLFFDDCQIYISEIYFLPGNIIGDLEYGVNFSPNDNACNTGRTPEETAFWKKSPGLGANQSEAVLINAVLIYYF